MKYLWFTAALLCPPLALAQQISDNHEQRKNEISELRQGLARITMRLDVLEQAVLVVEHLPTPEEGNRFGGRLVRDYSNKQFFLTDTPGVLSQSQSTATLGPMYSWGTKGDSW
jgi:hypothetical protein